MKWFFFPISELLLATLIQKEKNDKKSFHCKEGRLTEILQAVRCHIFMIVLIPYINLLNLYWIIKRLFLGNMEPLNICFLELLGKFSLGLKKKLE